MHCQAFGHTQSYCKRDYACVKRAGKHATEKCILKKDQKPKCVNCRGHHVASYRECPIAKDQQERRNKNLITRREKSNKTSSDDKNNIQGSNTKKSDVKSEQEQLNKSYADIIKNRRKEENDTSRDISLLIFVRLDEQDKIIKALVEKVDIIDRSTKKPIESK